MIKEAIGTLVSGKSLTMDEAAAVMEEIMSGEATPAQFGAFVTALRIKGETAEEITGLARTMRAKAVPVVVAGQLLDTCGTGGDAAATFNISTATAFIAAGAGLKVAKHGNRAMSSHCGSADVLEALGVKIDLNAENVQKCIEKVGIGFMFAPMFHPAMKYASAPRREIGIRTIFNILGPLTNPAGAKTQVLGVSDGAVVDKMAQVLMGLGCQHGLIVHGEDGLDEITINGKTRVREIKDGSIRSYDITPEDFGIPVASLDSLKGGTAQENAAMMRDILGGNVKGAKLDVVLMNSAGAVLAGDKVKTLDEGLKLAREVVAKGQALAKLDEFVKYSQSLS
ncbi:MAG: anthranilate phosphoribosyltransferase [Chloroflexota bacterium]